MFGGTRLGATWLGDRHCQFCVWASHAERVEVHLHDDGDDRYVPLEPRPFGYFTGIVEASCGARYLYRLDGRDEWPDPASRFQPEGTRGPSAVVETGFAWTDAHWRGPSLSDYIIYELHTGAFTPDGTFEAIIPVLPELRDLGVTALELMPIAQFSGQRNWGYDGVFPFAAQDSYGGPRGLKRLVNACHEQGLAIILDVVYNHLGPEGNCINQFGPYFTDRNKTPWGDAVNYDGPHSDQVRRYFIENALYWIEDCHFDALRLDAVHAIRDHSAFTFLEELAQIVHERAEQQGRRAYLIAESDQNDRRLITPRAAGGYDYDAQWADDFHHTLHALLTGERTGYYADYGEPFHLVKALQDGFVYTGQYSAYRQCRHGSPARDLPGRKFVICAQNHDQVGNRMLGERLAGLVGFEQLKLAAGALLLAPAVPLLFMGEEYGEEAPFLYFTSHTDEELIEAVRCGRTAEFSAFIWQGRPPDPHAEETYLRSKLNRDLRRTGRHRALFEFYRELIRLRRTLPALAEPDRTRLEARAVEGEPVILLRRWAVSCLGPECGRENGERADWSQSGTVLAIFNFSERETDVRLAEGVRHKILDSADIRWLGPGRRASAQHSEEPVFTIHLQPYSVVLYLDEEEG